MRHLKKDIEPAPDVPFDVCHWIVQMQAEFDQCDLTPLQAVQLAAREIRRGHCWIVINVRSGLTWSVDLGRGEVVEVVKASPLSTEDAP